MSIYRSFVWALFGSLFLIITPSTGVHAGKYLNNALGFVCQGKICTISRNMGGYLVVFQAAAREVLREGKRLVINGECRSACAILADKARPNVCITSRARFGFHKAYVSKIVGGKRIKVPVYDPPQSPDIDRWVKARGGYPAPGKRHRWMSASEARVFWRIC